MSLPVSRSMSRGAKLKIDALTMGRSSHLPADRKLWSGARRGVPEGELSSSWHMAVLAAGMGVLRSAGGWRQVGILGRGAR